MTDGLLPSTSCVDGIERKRDFDELLRGDNGVVGHGKGSISVGKRLFDTISKSRQLGAELKQRTHF
jgi:hypothetical protein